MHAKSDSEVTSIEASTPPRSPRRPLYYVQSPSNNDPEKLSCGWSPAASPPHHYYHCSPIHHSRESSTSRFSASALKNPSSYAWRKLHQRDHNHDVDDDGGGDEEDGEGEYGKGYAYTVRLYACFLVMFLLLFALFSLILWGASKSYRPVIVVKSMVFENFNIQAGSDGSGVPTDMLSLNSTVRILYRNPATFFGVHVTSTPLLLFSYQLQVASGHMTKFYQPRKSHRTMVTVVMGHQVPLYGGLPELSNFRGQNVVVPLNITFVIRSRAHILGKLVKSKFYTKIRCSVALRGSQLGKAQNLTNSCTYH